MTEQHLKSFPEHSDGEVEQVLPQADLAYRQIWRGLLSKDRGAVLKRAVTELRTNTDHFAKLVTLEMGKVFQEALDEVERWDAGPQVPQHRVAHLPAYLRSWLDDTGAPMGVQQKLMRHAQISTRMNVYGNALMEAKREANAAVVNRILRSASPMKASVQTCENPAEQMLLLLHRVIPGWRFR